MIAYLLSIIYVFLGSNDTDDTYIDNLLITYNDSEPFINDIMNMTYNYSSFEIY